MFTSVNNIDYKLITSKNQDKYPYKCIIYQLIYTKN